MNLEKDALSRSYDYLPHPDEKDAKPKLTRGDQIKFIFSHISLEPMVLVYAICTILNQLTTQNLNLEKACRVNLNFNTSICDAMVLRNKSGYEQYQEQQVQELVSKAAAFKSVCMGSFPALLMLFFGSWSDRHGRRKPVILVPMCGEVFTCVCLFICSYFFLELPIEINALSESLPFCVTGAWFCTFLGVYSYVSGLSSDENKTVRIGAISMCLHIGVTVGIFLSGFLIKPLGFKGVYTLSFSMMLFAIIYGYIMIKDNRIIQEGTGKQTNFFKDFFELEHVKGTFRMCFNEGPDNRKLKMIVIMFIAMMVMGPFYGEFTVLYLYTRLKFGWNEVDYSIFNTTHFLIQILGSLFALIFFTKFLKIDDAMLGAIAIISKMIACLTYAFAPSWQIFYLGAIIEVFHGTTHIALRSIMAKIVPPHELGQTNSVFGICEAMMPLIFGPVYTSMYNYFMRIFPGTFYLVSAALYIITLSLFIWLYKMNKRDLKLKLEIQKNVDQEENLLKKACFNEIKKSMEKLKSNHSLHRTE